MAGSSAVGSQMARILDTDGTPIATALTHGPGADGVVELEEIDGAGRLLNRCFGRGEWDVLLEVDGRTLEGAIETRWVASERIWWVHISQPLTILGAAAGSISAILERSESLT